MFKYWRQAKEKLTANNGPYFSKDCKSVRTNRHFDGSLHPFWVSKVHLWRQYHQKFVWPWPNYFSLSKYHALICESSKRAPSSKTRRNKKGQCVYIKVLWLVHRLSKEGGTVGILCSTHTYRPRKKQTKKPNSPNALNSLFRKSHSRKANTAFLICKRNLVRIFGEAVYLGQASKDAAAHPWHTPKNGSSQSRVSRTNIEA